MVGVTSNPTIFAAALAKGERYADQVRALADRGVDVDTAAFEITTDDVRSACDVFAPVYENSDGLDGRVSIEVDPRLAHQERPTIEAARRLWATVDRPNALIKIPATLEGLPAITAALADAISVNVTLIFSLERYRAVMNAWLTGLEAAHAAGRDLSRIDSVASFFVSRVDSEVDARLGGIGTSQASCAARPGRGRQRPARLPGVRGGHGDLPLAGARRRRGPPAAPAVGLHRGEGPELLGHHVRHRAGRSGHRQHHAG